MHILIGLLTLLGVIALWIWRVRAAADATREIVDAASDARSALRRYGYRRKAGQHPADNVDDPRLAASGIMAAIARMDGDLTAEQANALRVECRASFRVGQREADDMAAYGRWLVDQSPQTSELIRRLTRTIREQAPSDAHQDLLRMMERIASVEGGEPSDFQRDAIHQVKRGLLI
ncbi:MAG: TerB family tellurite resistance protein [Rhodobacteraceae bacterium]|nr:TerB family tellurite resistance protein [Paracoccaceae bacterium]